MIERAAIYSRVSTAKQAEEGYSLESQIENCTNYAKRHGFVIEHIIQDEASGAKLERPGLASLRDLIVNGRINTVIVHSSDRLTRNLAHSLLLRDEMKQAGVILHYVNKGQVEDTPESKMTEDIEGVFNDYWRTKITEGSKRGKRQKAKQGKWVGGPLVRYGYKKVGKGKNATLAINEQEAEIVKRIFGMYLGTFHYDKVPLREIANRLTQEGIPPPGGPAGKGVRWYGSTIRRSILKNRAYIGEFSYMEIVIKLPELAIIDEQTWQAAQQQMNRNKTRSKRNRKNKYLLTQHLRCTCKASMTGTTKYSRQGELYLYYRCTDRIHGNPNGCKEKYLRVDICDTLVWNWLVGLLQDEEQLDDGLNEMIDRSKSQHEPLCKDLERVEDLINEYEQELEQLMSEFAGSKNSRIAKALKNLVEKTATKIEYLEREKEILEGKIAQTEFTQAMKDEIKAIARQVRSKLPCGKFEKKRRMLDILNLDVQLRWEEDKRFLDVTCSIHPERVWEIEYTMSAHNLLPRPVSQLAGD